MIVECICSMLGDGWTMEIMSWSGQIYIDTNNMVTGLVVATMLSPAILFKRCSGITKSCSESSNDLLYLKESCKISIRVGQDAATKNHGALHNVLTRNILSMIREMSVYCNEGVIFRVLTMFCI